MSACYVVTKFFQFILKLCVYRVMYALGKFEENSSNPYVSLVLLVPAYIPNLIYAR